MIEDFVSDCFFFFFFFWSIICFSLLSYSECEEMFLPMCMHSHLPLCSSIVPTALGSGKLGPEGLWFPLLHVTVLCRGGGRWGIRRGVTTLLSTLQGRWMAPCCPRFQDASISSLFLFFCHRTGLISGFQGLPSPWNHLITYHFSGTLLTSELEKIMLLSRASKLNEKIYVEGLTVAGTKGELRKDLCPPLLHHLFPPKTARRERRTKYWPPCGSF